MGRIWAFLRNIGGGGPSPDDWHLAHGFIAGRPSPQPWRICKGARSLHGRPYSGCGAWLSLAEANGAVGKKGFMHILAMFADNSSGVWPWNALPWFIGVAFLALGLVEKIEKSSAFKFRPPNSHGAAKLAGNDDLKKAGLFGGKGVPIGYSPDGKRPLHYPGFGHLLTVAAARTGKGATLLVNALLSWRHSAIIIDPKCENALVTAKFRQRLGKVYILNPFRMFPEELRGMIARFNPLDILDAAALSFHTLCDKLAAALVWDEGHEGQHWTTAARILVSGIIAALVRHGLPGKITLVEVARGHQQR